MTWSTRRKILFVAEQGNLSCNWRDQPLPWIDLVPDDFLEDPPEKLSVYTDGSLTKLQGNLSNVFGYGDEVDEVSSGVVIIASSDKWKEKKILALRIGPAQSNGMSSYDAEIIAAFVGASMATADWNCF